MSESRDEKKKRRREEKRQRQWAEVEEYRALLEAPEPNRFDEGFTIRTVIGVLFISLIMTPGEMFLGLYTGGGVGAAAQWVTVILFLEVSKRSFTSLKRQEIYLLVYVASALIAREEGAFLDLLWRQYFVRSAEAELFGVSRILPWWWAPPHDSEAIAERTFIHRDWLAPILLLVLGTIMGRIAWFTSGYMLFRLTSDREQLPFPTAPMSALSAMALAEDSGAERETWKWPVFSIGAAIGASFGVIYVGVPVITQLWGSKVEILPIPFWDLTPYFGNILPATPLGIAVHLGPIFSGMLMPFWSVIGSFSGVMLHTAVSPFLYELGYLPRWEVGMDTIQTSIATGIDFWRAFSIGITIAVTIVSFYQLFSTGREKRAELREKLQLEKGRPADGVSALGLPSPGRGEGILLKAPRPRRFQSVDLRFAVLRSGDLPDRLGQDLVSHVGQHGPVGALCAHRLCLCADHVLCQRPARRLSRPGDFDPLCRGGHSLYDWLSRSRNLVRALSYPQLRRARRGV